MYQYVIYQYISHILMHTAILTYTFYGSAGSWTGHQEEVEALCNSLQVEAIPNGHLPRMVPTGALAPQSVKDW